MELSSPTFVAFISKEPKRFTVPLDTSSPTVLSTGIGSPVITAWSIEVCPEVMIPSTAIPSPGKTRRISPIFTSLAGITNSVPLRMTLAVCGVNFTNFSMPARAFATVKSSSRAPICIIKATSPAAKFSPIQTGAISASDTSTSALISNAVTSPIIASKMIGTPHKTIETQAILKGKKSNIPVKLKIRARPERARSVISFFVPPISSKCSSFPINAFIEILRSIP